MKIQTKPTPTPIAMFKRMLHRLQRRWPSADNPLPVQHWNNEDVSWHSSSFELARGLEVIEHRDVAPAVFFDTLPAWRRAEA